jgi:molybdopterin molybdotransferase
MKFFNTLSLDQAVDRMLEKCHPEISKELVSIDSCLGRTLFEDLAAPYPLPQFARSTVDGYAVHSADTTGASDNIPAMFDLIGEVQMGQVAEMRVGEGQAVYVPTGGMIPNGANCMVMIEDTQRLKDTLLVQKPCYQGENCSLVGEDIADGEVILTRGTEIAGEQIGLLSALSFAKVPVVKAPSFAIISTGDEIVPLDQEMKPGQIRDINSYTLAALIREYGGVVVKKVLLGDQKDQLQAAVRECAQLAEITLISGGSSVGTRDYTQEVIESLPGGELLVSGINIKPGKPTLVGCADDKLIIGLPGHPVSSVIVFHALIGAYLDRRYALHGKKIILPAILEENFASAPGKTTFQGVTLRSEAGQLFATPIYSQSAWISQLVRSDAYIVLPADKEGLSKGEIVDVVLFRR